jgi:opacity protein-like surface antigen
MRSNSILRYLLVASLFFSPPLLKAQVIHSAMDRNQPLAVGGGLSGFDPGLERLADNYFWKTGGSGVMLGATGWVDYYPHCIPPVLHGLGVEAEVRNTSWRRSDLESNFRQTTAGGGAIYSWRHFADFRPYGKAGAASGWINYAPASHLHHSDTRTVTYFGGGFEYRVWRKVWFRADYEYQMWPELLGLGTVSPQGVTLGATYHFGRIRTH